MIVADVHHLSARSTKGSANFAHIWRGIQCYMIAHATTHMTAVNLVLVVNGAWHINIYNTVDT